MLIAAFLLAAAFGQAPSAPATATDCAAALARSTSSATAQVCLAEAAFERARVTPKGSAAWTQELRNAAGLYKRALALPAEDLVKLVAVERLLVIYGPDYLHDPAETIATFGELIRLEPTEAEPLVRLATYQESQAAFAAAEETLLSARRLQPDSIEPVKALAQFYARRAGAMHTRSAADAPREEVAPGEPDRDGAYRVGGGVPPPRRVGSAVYPADATAVGAEGAVVAEILVDETGTVADARVLKSNPLLDEAALKAVREWRYDPTLVNGVPVPVRMTVTVNFSLRR